MNAVLIIIFAAVFFAGGWYCKSRFGAKAAAVVKDVAG